MKKIMIWSCLIGLLLVSCGQATTPAPTATRFRGSDTPTASAAPLMTATRMPTARPSLTPLPTISGYPDLPAVPEKMPPHKLALNEFNTGTGMKRLNIYGTGKLNDFAFSSDGKYLAAATGRGIFLYDSKTFEQTSFIDTNGPVDAIAFSPDDPLLAVAVGGEVSLWNILSGQQLTTMDDWFPWIWTLAYGKGGHIAAAGSDCSGCGTPVRKMAIWAANTGEEIYVEKDITYITEGLVFTEDGKRLAYGGEDGLSLWDVDKKEKIAIPPTARRAGENYYTAYTVPTTFIFNKDETSLFVLSRSADAQAIEISSGKGKLFDRCDLGLAQSQTSGVCFKNGKIVLFDLLNGEKLSEINVPDYDDDWDSGRIMAISPNGETIAYKSKDFLHIVDVKTAREIKALTFTTFDNVQSGMVLLNAQLTYVAAIPNGHGQVDLINVENGTHLQTYSLPRAKIEGFAFRPDQKTAATLDDTHTLTLWNIQTQRILYKKTFSEALSASFTFSPDGLSLFFMGRQILMMKRPSSKLQAVGMNSYADGFANPSVPNNYHFSQNGNLILFNIKADQPMITDTKTKQVKVIPFEIVNEERYLEMADHTLNPDDTLIAFGTTKNIFVWNTETLKQVSMLVGHDSVGGDGFYGMIKRVSFSPQSDLLVSVGWDGTTRLWNVHAGQELRRLNVCCQAMFTPDGRYLLTAGDGVLRVWGIP